MIVKAFADAGSIDLEGGATIHPIACPKNYLIVAAGVSPTAARRRDSRLLGEIDNPGLCKFLQAFLAHLGTETGLLGAAGCRRNRRPSYRAGSTNAIRGIC